MTELCRLKEVREEHAQLWNLILRVTDEAEDDLIQSLRVALFAELCRWQECGIRSNAENLAASLWSFRSVGRPAKIPKISKNLPLLLFPYSTGSHMLNLLPVAREAKGRNLLGGIAAGSVRTGDLSEFNDVIPQRLLQSLAGAELLPQIMRKAWRSFRRLVDAFSQETSRHALRLKRNYGAMIRYLVLSERMAIAFRRLLSEWEPSCVISTSDHWPFEFQLYCQAKRFGIPNAVIQHGEPNGVISWPVYADTLLVWGDRFRERFLEIGAPLDRLRVCGMPAMDDLSIRFQQGGAEPVNKTLPVCVVFSHTHDRCEESELFDDFARYLAQVIHLTPHVRWKIKLHPAEGDDFYREHGLIANDRVEILPRNVSLQRAVEEADVTCTIRSTAGLEAMMMKKPVIVMDLVPGRSIWWPRYGGGLAAKTATEFEKQLNRLMDDEEFRTSVLNSQKEFLEQTFANKGKAAASIVDYLEEQTSAAIDRKETSPREINATESVGAV